jgi:hypothetical protein
MMYQQKQCFLSLRASRQMLARPVLRSSVALAQNLTFAQAQLLSNSQAMSFFTLNAQARRVEKEMQESRLVMS